jgi:hypothetical protein
MVGAGLFVGLDALARGEKLTAACLFAGFRGSRARPLALLSICMLVITATQLAVGAPVYGTDVLGLAVGRHPAAMASFGFRLVLLLPGLVPSMLSMLATPAVVLDGVPPGRAIVLSVRAGRFPGAFGGWLLLSLGMFALALLALGPFMLPPTIGLPAWTLAVNHPGTCCGASDSSGGG